MARFLAWIVVLFAVALLGWWGWSAYGPHHSGYAPNGKVDAELDAQPTPTPLPKAPLVAPKADANGLPPSPIPYDQLKKGETVGEVNTAPPEKKSDEKAVFY